MTLRTFAFAMALMAALTSRVWAHHSFAMFDRDQRVTLVGDVKELEIENPHSWLRVLVRGDQNQTLVWSFEMGPPGLLRRLGWSQDVVQVGDRVSVQFFPMKDGSSAGQLISVTFPDGKKLAGFTPE
jgi:hypothetical protein